jgi:ACR3 family arsenite transporter
MEANKNSASAFLKCTSRFGDFLHGYSESDWGILPAFAVSRQFEYAKYRSHRVLIWLMIYPMMLKVIFRVSATLAEIQGHVCHVGDELVIKPFTLFGIAWLFFFGFSKRDSGGARRIIWLGDPARPAPCTAWSLSGAPDHGKPLHVVQVATND